MLAHTGYDKAVPPVPVRVANRLRQTLPASVDLSRTPGCIAKIRAAFTAPRGTGTLHHQAIPMITNDLRPNKSGRTEQTNRAETVSYDGEQWHIDAIDDGLAHLSREGQPPHIVPVEHLDTVNDGNGDEETGGDGQMRLDDFGTCRRLMTDGGHPVEGGEDETTLDFSAGVQVPEEDAESGVPDDYDPDDGDAEDDSINEADSTPITGSPEQWREHVPQSMQEIDRWLMWSGEPDTPRRPHWRGDFSVSYNDPDDWHSFEDAVEAAAETDSWGIGFVTGDDISVIDFDGVKGDDGRPVDWAPGLGRLRRAYDDDGGPYVEWSPSGTGFHIPVSGMEKPDWWTDLSVDDRKHEGVDLLQGQFVTVTGATERSFDGGVIEHCDAVDFLLQETQEAITSLNGGTDLVNNGEGGDWTPDDEWLTEDDIREALTHINADCGYNQWRNIGFAVAEYYHREDGDSDGKERAKALYKEWSKTADEKWDSQAEQQAERIVEDSWDRIDAYQESDGSSPVTVGTLVAYAQEAGWEMPAPPQEVVADDVDETDWDNVEEDRQSVEWREGNDAVTEARDDVVGWAWRKDDDGEPVEIIGLTVAEPIDAVDEVYCTLDLDVAQREHRVDADTTTRLKMPSRVARRVVNHEPLHKLAHRLDALYNDCLNAEARSVAVQRILQALEVVTVGGQDDKTLYVYDPGTGIYDDDGREVVRAVVESVCPARASDHEKREIVSKIADRTREPESEAFEPRGEFDDEHHDYRVVGNGILRLPTLQPDGSVCDAELLEFDPDLRARKRIPVDYNTDADTLEVEEWLDDITAREEDRMAIVEAIGNILLPDYRHPKITMMYGDGRNSKGTILDVIVEMLGGVESSNVAGNRLGDLADNKFRTGMLKQAMVNVNGDIAERKIQHGSKLKELTGGEAQEGESKNEDAETFRNSAKLWFAGNSPPLPPETTTAWQERWLPIHLPFKFTSDPDPNDPFEKEADKNIKRKMTREDNLEAMLLLAVEGLARLEEQGDVSLPESPEERLEAYKDDADPISRVEATLIEAVRSPESKADKYVPKAAVYEGYKSMARDDGMEPVPKNRFFSILEDRMEELPYHESRPQAPEGVDNNREYSLRGVRFREDAVEHLSDYWLSHPWVQVSETAGDRYGAGDTDTTEGEREELTIEGIRSVPQSLLQTGQRVDVTDASLVEWSVMPEQQVYALGGAVHPGGDDEMDVVAFDCPANVDALADEIPCYVEIRGAVLDTYEGDLQLQMDEDTVVHVVETTDDDQETVDDAAGTVNDAEGEGEGEHTTPSASDGGETAQRGVRADGSGSGDAEAIDEAVLRAAQDGADTVPAIAGQVATAVDSDLETVKHRIEKLAQRGDIILDDLVIGEDGGEDDDEDGSSEGTSNHIPVAEALRRVGGRKGLSVDDAVAVLQHDTAVPPGREWDALEVADAVDVSGEHVVVTR